VACGTDLKVLLSVLQLRLSSGYVFCEIPSFLLGLLAGWSCQAAVCRNCMFLCQKWKALLTF